MFEKDQKVIVKSKMLQGKIQQNHEVQTNQQLNQIQSRCGFFGEGIWIFVKFPAEQPVHSGRPIVAGVKIQELSSLLTLTSV